MLIMFIIPQTVSDVQNVCRVFLEKVYILVHRINSESSIVRLHFSCKVAVFEQPDPDGYTSTVYNLLTPSEYIQGICINAESLTSAYVYLLFHSISEAKMLFETNNKYAKMQVYHYNKFLLIC